jgi:hypothetical protein
MLGFLCFLFRIELARHSDVFGIRDSDKKSPERVTNQRVIAPGRE